MIDHRIEPIWIRSNALVSLTSQSIMHHGGTKGTVKYDLLDSALHKPQHLWHYEKVDDLATLAVAYAMAISQNHPFTDGNKRAAYIAIGLFLEGNGQFVTADQMEAYSIIMSLAQNEIDQPMLIHWLKQNMKKLDD